MRDAESDSGGFFVTVAYKPSEFAKADIELGTGIRHARLVLEEVAVLPVFAGRAAVALCSERNKRKEPPTAHPQAVHNERLTR